MKYFALAIFSLLMSINFASAKTVACQKNSEAFESLYAEAFFNTNPYCMQAVRNLKNKPIENQKDFNKKVESEVSEITKYFDQRNTSFYGVISKPMKMYRHKRQANMSSPRDVREASFEGLTGSCDKLKHCAVSCKLAYSCGFYGSRVIGRLKEIFHDLIFGKGTADFDDIIANEVGLSISANIVEDDSKIGAVYAQCENLCAENILRLHTVYFDYKDEKFCKE